MTEYRPLYRLCTAVMLLALVGVYLQFRVRNNRFNQGHNVDAMRDRGYDLEAYHLFASQWWAGESPYSKVARSGPNPYPPFFTLFFSPFALLPFQTAFLAVSLVSTAELVLSVYASTHERRRAPGLAEGRDVDGGAGADVPDFVRPRARHAGVDHPRPHEQRPVPADPRPL